MLQYQLAKIGVWSFLKNPIIQLLFYVKEKTKKKLRFEKRHRVQENANTSIFILLRIFFSTNNQEKIKLKS